ARRHVGRASELGEGRWREEVLHLLELQRRLVRRGAARHGGGVYGDGWGGDCGRDPPPRTERSPGGGGEGPGGTGTRLLMAASRRSRESVRRSSTAQAG